MLPGFPLQDEVQSRQSFTTRGKCTAGAQSYLRARRLLRPWHPRRCAPRGRPKLHRATGSAGFPAGHWEQVLDQLRTPIQWLLNAHAHFHILNGPPNQSLSRLQVCSGSLGATSPRRLSIMTAA